MLKQFHLFGRGDVLADAVKSERSQEKHWDHTDQGELLPLTCLSSSLRVTEVWTDNDCRGVEYCRNTRACFWTVKWKDKRRKQDPGILDDTTESGISQEVPWIPIPQQRYRYHVATRLVSNSSFTVFLSVLVEEGKWLRWKRMLLCCRVWWPSSVVYLS